MYERRYLVALVAFLGFFASGISTSWACSAPASCDTIVERGGMASCVKVYPGSCETMEATIDNQCDQSVEFVELECGDDCAEPVVFQPGDKAELLFTRPASEGNEAYEYASYPVGWSMGDQEGVLDVRVEYDEQTVECGDDAGCTTAGGQRVPVSLALVGFASVLVGGRRRCRD